MAKIGSKDSQILVGIGESPTLLNNARDWTMTCNRNTIDVSTISTEWKEYLTGQIEAAGSFTLLFDPEDTMAGAAVETGMWEGTQLTFYIRPTGSTPGDIQYTLTALVTSWELSAATEDAIQISVSYTGTGPIVKGVVPGTPPAPEKPDPILNLSTETIELAASADGTVVYATTSDGTASVGTSDDTVATATVADNVITISALAEGTATITLSIAESATYNAATATVAVTVTA